MSTTDEGGITFSVMNPLDESETFDAEAESPAAKATREQEAQKSDRVTSQIANMSEFMAEEHHPAWRQAFILFEAHPAKASLSGFATLLALFLPDYHYAYLGTAYDTLVVVLLSFTVVFFTLEMISTLLSEKNAIYTLFFWLDMFATVSLIPEVPWLNSWLDPTGWDMFQTRICESVAASAANTAKHTVSGNSGAMMMRAGRAARAGARAGRLQGLVRAARLLRMIRHRTAKKPGYESAEEANVVPAVLAAKISDALARVLIILVIVAVVFTSILEYRSPAPPWQSQTIDILRNEWQTSADQAAALQSTCEAGGGSPFAMENETVNCYAKVLSHMESVNPTASTAEFNDYIDAWGFRPSELFYVEVCLGNQPCNLGYDAGVEVSTGTIVRGMGCSAGNDGSGDCDGSVTPVPMGLDYKSILSHHEDIRVHELVDVYVCSEGVHGGYSGRAVFNGKYDVQAAAISRMQLTGLVVTLLVGFGFVLSAQMNNFVALPMQRLVKSQALSEALVTILRDHKDVISTLERSSKKILNCEVVNIFIKDEIDQCMWCARSAMDTTPYNDELRIPFGVGIVGGSARDQVIKREAYKKPQDVPRDSPSLRSDIPAEGKMKAREWVGLTAICYPLLCKVGNTTEVVGAMEAINKKPEKAAALDLMTNLLQVIGVKSKDIEDQFTEFDEDMLTMFGDQISNIIKSYQADAMYDKAMDSDNPMAGMLADMADNDQLAAAKRRKQGHVDEHLLKVFNSFDLDGTGFLNKSEIHDMSKQLGKDYSDDEMDAIMGRMTEGAVGTEGHFDDVNYDQFAAWWNKAQVTDLKAAVKKHAADMEALQSTQVTRMLQGMDLPSREELREWGHSCLDYTVEQMVGATLLIFTDPALGFKSAFDKFDPEVIQNFTKAAYGRYNQVPYHNVYHGFSVLQGCYSLISTTKVMGQLTDVEKYAMLISGVGHDMGHGGLNTTFLTASDSDLAMMYNDKSPLENMHSRETFMVMRDAKCDALACLGEQRRDARRLIVDAIIGTDMAFHKHHMDQLAGRSTINMDEPTDREMMLSLLVHLADVGATSYGWTDCVRWGRMVMTEFQTQVYREGENSIPVSSYMDLGSENQKDAFAKSQMGFIDFVLLPFFLLFPPHIPEMKAFADQLASNRKSWGEVQAGKKKLPKATKSDDEKMAWSVNVGRDSFPGGAIPVAKMTGIKPTIVLSSKGAVDKN